MVEEYSLKTPKSKTLFKRAEKVFPSGVSYGIRYFEPYPFFTAEARGSKLYDVDGNTYVDFWLGHTALVLGHSPPDVMSAVRSQLGSGTIFGTSHEAEVALAEQVVKMVPSAEMVRFTNSGTEANMYATRLARAHTGRNKIAKFEGGWHGGYDALHKGVRVPYELTESAGLSPGALQDTILLPFNDLEGVTARLKGEAVASVTIEPVLGAGGCIPAEREFLKGLREFCSEKDILLIFDEVITGFRLAPGGAQQHYGVTPDLTVLGKILGGGFPVGAFCGRKEIMERIDPRAFERPRTSFHGGTFAANPITMKAGLVTLKHLEDGKLLNDLNSLGDRTRERLRAIFDENTSSGHVTGTSSLFNVHFAKDEVRNAGDVARTDKRMLLDYNLWVMSRGVFFLPAHSGALCTEHTTADLEKLFSETASFLKRHKT